MLRQVIDEPSQMRAPVCVTFWEMDRMNPSSEDTSLCVFDIQATGDIRVSAPPSFGVSVVKA